MGITDDWQQPSTHSAFLILIIIIMSDNVLVHTIKATSLVFLYRRVFWVAVTFHGFVLCFTSGRKMFLYLQEMETQSTVESILTFKLPSWRAPQS